MTTFAEPPPSAAGGADTCQSISEIINTHFDNYQRGDSDGSSSSTKKNVSRAAEALHHDILSFVLSHKNTEDELTEEEVSEEIAATVTRCMDCAMAVIAKATGGTKKDSWAESVTSILELSAAYATASSKDELVARSVIQRAMEYSTVEKDAIRTASCTMLGWSVKHLVESSKPAMSILKKKGGKNGSSGGVVNTKKNNVAASGWKLECLVDVGRALQPRLTDESSEVRNAAIFACGSFFPEGKTIDANSNDFEKMIASIQKTLLEIMKHDSSAPNRVLVTQSECVSADTIPYLIERVRDVDVKVREATLDSLRENVNLDELTEDQRVEILRYGLTKR